MVESFFSDKLGMYTIHTSLCMCLCRLAQMDYMINNSCQKI